LRVLLVNPRTRLPIETRTTPHLGLAYLAAVSEARGDTVSVFDMDVEEVELERHLADFRPDIVGVTANTPQVKQAWRVARTVKEQLGVPVVLGGPHVSALPKESAERPEVDAVVEGEGEATWVELCTTVERVRLGEGRDDHALREAFRAVQGIHFRDSDGEIIATPERPAIADLDGMPWPAYHLFKMERYTNLQPTVDHVNGQFSFSVLTSRGCPYRCTFCSQSIMPQKWRSRSPESVLAEWKHLANDLGAQEIGILDDSANIKVKRIHQICNLLIDNKLNHVPWIFVNGIRANLSDEFTLGLMKRAGCKRTAFGVETGDPRILESVDKRLTLDQVRAAFKAAKRVGLETIGFFIIGLPGETEESMNNTIKFACELDPLVANFSMMTPFPGTRVWELVHSQGGKMLVDDWDDYIFFEGKARYEMGTVTAELTERMWRKAYRRFYLRPHRIARTLRRKETWQNWSRTGRVAWRVAFSRRAGAKSRTRILGAVSSDA
jgi:radical SAM superfamily enzyme YgiQ (UPF0313 family)